MASPAERRPCPAYQTQTAHGNQPSASSSDVSGVRTGAPASVYLAAQVPDGYCTLARNRRMLSDSAKWPVAAKAAAAQLESRGQEYFQRPNQAAAMAPPGRVSSRRSMSAPRASRRCAGVLPGTVPAASQRRSAEPGAGGPLPAGPLPAGPLPAGVLPAGVLPAGVPSAG